MASIPPCLPDSLRKFSESHIDEDLTGVSLGYRENGLFHGCTFKKLAGATLKDCDLFHSRFVTERVEDALGLTLTLDCNSFDEVEYSPLLFDLMLVLLMKTKGNNEKRRKLFDLLGKERVRELLHKLGQVES